MTSAIVFGATGLVGKHCVEVLQKNTGITRVGAVSRRPLKDNFFTSQDKITTHIIDFEHDLFNDTQTMVEILKRYSLCFLCLGSTIKQAGSQTAFARIDLDYTAQAAVLAKQAGISTVAMVTAMGSSASSPFFYSKTKAQSEKAVLNLKFEHSIIARPSIILGQREEKRIAEDFSKPLMQIINPLLLGPLQKYKAIHASTIASGIVHYALHTQNSLDILYHRDLIDAHHI